MEIFSHKSVLAAAVFAALNVQILQGQIFAAAILALWQRPPVTHLCTSDRWVTVCLAAQTADSSLLPLEKQIISRRDVPLFSLPAPPFFFLFFSLSLSLTLGSNAYASCVSYRPIVLRASDHSQHGTGRDSL